VNVHFDFAFVVGRIVHEAVMNSLKHAFDEAVGGQIGVRLGRDSDGLEISVADDGRGMAPIEPTSPHTGLGLELIAQLVKHAGGTLDIRSGPGLSIVVRFRRTDSTGDGAP
jgi:two-component sensor histidine kinase